MSENNNDTGLAVTGLIKLCSVSLSVSLLSWSLCNSSLPGTPSLQSKERRSGVPLQEELSENQQSRKLVNSQGYAIAFKFLVSDHVRKYPAFLKQPCEKKSICQQSRRLTGDCLPKLANKPCVKV